MNERGGQGMTGMQSTDESRADTEHLAANLFYIFRINFKYIYILCSLPGYVFSLHRPARMYTTVAMYCRSMVYGIYLV
jgi:hypothetical protein